MKMTDDELKDLMTLYMSARNTPVMAFSVSDGLSGNDFQSQAQKRFDEKWIDICHKYKLHPDVTGFNSKTGEFVS